jgi:hypothetical protein
MPVRFFLAFVVVFGLIGLTAWLVRRFGTARLGESTRGRQPRLAVIEAGAVDGRRRLVLVRRDNVEHLIMIGGPSDIVVEQNIVRGQAAIRDAGPVRAAAPADTMPRALPEQQNGWPLQPEPAPRPVRPLEEPAHWSFEPAHTPAAPTQAAQRPARVDPLAGLAAELSARPSYAEQPAPQPARAPAAQAAQPMAHAEPAADQNLADMAQRLEAALRRPGAEQRPAPKPAATNGAARPQAEAPQIRAETRNAEPAADDKAAFSSLEEEMASLLGRKG